MHLNKLWQDICTCTMNRYLNYDGGKVFPSWGDSQFTFGGHKPSMVMVNSIHRGYRKENGINPHLTMVGRECVDVLMSVMTDASWFPYGNLYKNGQEATWLEFMYDFSFETDIDGCLLRLIADGEMSNRVGVKWTFIPNQGSMLFKYDETVISVVGTSVNTNGSAFDVAEVLCQLENIVSFLKSIK